MTRKGGWEPTGFGPKLKALREKTGLTLNELAEKAGCHWNTLAKLERGEQEPAWPLVLTLCQALGVDCTAFIQEPAGSAEPRPRGRPRKAEAEKKASQGKRKSR